MKRGAVHGSERFHAAELHEVVVAGGRVAEVQSEGQSRRGEREKEKEEGKRCGEEGESDVSMVRRSVTGFNILSAHSRVNTAKKTLDATRSVGGSAIIIPRQLVINQFPLFTGSKAYAVACVRMRSHCGNTCVHAHSTVQLKKAS